MRPLKDIERSVAKVPIRTDDQVDEAVRRHLLQELSQVQRPLVAGAPIRIRWQVAGPLVCLAAAMFLVAALWLVRAGPARPEPRSIPAPSANASGIVLLTEISLERAFRRGGLEAVAEQYERAMAQPTRESTSPTTERLLAEMAGNDENAGGTNL